MKKRWKRIILILLLLVLLAPLLTYVALKTSWGQAYATERVSELLSDELGLPVSIEEISFRPFETIGLQRVLVLDHHQDTLLAAERLYAEIDVFSLSKRRIHLGRIELDNGLVDLHKYRGEDDLNIEVLIDRLSSEDNAAPWDVQLSSLELQQITLRHRDDNKERLPVGRLDASHLELRELKGRLYDIAFIEKGIRFRAEELSAMERSGLALQSLDAWLSIDEGSIDIREMELMTHDSELRGELLVDYSAEEQEELILRADLSRSAVKLAELGHFIPGYEHLAGQVQVDAQIEGQLSDLVLSKSTIRFGTQSILALDGRIRGLPSIEDLWLDVDISRLETSIDQLQYLPVPGMQEQVDKLPALSANLGAIAFAGHFKGYLEEFYAEGDLETDIGLSRASIHVDLRQEESQHHYLGDVEIIDFHLGRLLEQEHLGPMSSQLKIDMTGSGRSLQADLSGTVSALSYKGYTYRNLEVDGALEENLFNGFLSISQPEIDLDFNGLVDLRSAVPEFNFKAEIYQADIGGLGFLHELDSTSMNCVVIADFKGDDIDEFVGSVAVNALSFCRDDEEYFFDDFLLTSSIEDTVKTLALRSQMIEAQVNGQFAYRDIKRDFLAVFQEVLPSIYAKEDYQAANNTRMQFDIVLKETDEISRLFVPGLSVGAYTQVDGSLDSRRGHFELHCEADSLAYHFIQLQGVDMEMYKDGYIAYTSLETRDMQWGDSLSFKDNYYTFNAYNDTIETDFTWSLVNKDASGSISAMSVIHDVDSIASELYPSQMIMSGNYWLTQGFTQFDYHSAGLSIDSLVLSNGSEFLAAGGRIGSGPADRLDFDVRDFQLEHLNKFLPKDMVALDGKTTLKGHATSILGVPTVVADMYVNDMSIGGERVGNVDISSTWSQGMEFLDIAGYLENDGIHEVSLQGKYYPVADQDNLDAELSFDGFRLGILNKLPTGGVDQIGGRATGNLKVQGAALEPRINGELSFDNAQIRIDYLNTKYYFNDKVVVRDDYIGTNYIPFSDEFGNQGYLNGTVAHENYRNWNYDIFAEFEKMMVLNTDESMNPVFYGKVFGTGSVSIFGFDNNLTIEVFGRTEEGTSIDLPLGNADEVVLDDFVYFKSEEMTDSTSIDDRPPTSVELYMEVEATPDADIRLVFDEKIGDVMQGSGSGTLTMTLDRAGTLEIFGNYMIAQGDYLFTLQNVVNKRFKVSPGSTVSFFGDPYQAELDLVTVYTLRATLSELLTSEGLGYGNRVPVECKMELAGQLFNPEIDFSIDFPGLEPSLETLAQSKLDTEEELNRQVFSLLVLNKFLSSEPTDASAGLSAATTTINEFASSQLSNWLSQISDDVDVGVNYRSGDNITSEELAVALTTQLFNDRLLLTGNFGVQNAPSNALNQASSVIGDFRLEYILTKDGKLRLKVFNETNDYSFLNTDQAATKQGVGLVFQREFDGLFDDFKSE